MQVTRELTDALPGGGGRSATPRRVGDVAAFWVGVVACAAGLAAMSRVGTSFADAGAWVALFIVALGVVPVVVSGAYLLTESLYARLARVGRHVLMVVGTVLAALATSGLLLAIFFLGSAAGYSQWDRARSALVTAMVLGFFALATAATLSGSRRPVLTVHASRWHARVTALAALVVGLGVVVTTGAGVALAVRNAQAFTPVVVAGGVAQIGWAIARRARTSADLRMFADAAGALARTAFVAAAANAQARTDAAGAAVGGAVGAAIGAAIGADEGSQAGNGVGMRSHAGTTVPSGIGADDSAAGMVAATWPRAGNGPALELDLNSGSVATMAVVEALMQLESAAIADPAPVAVVTRPRLLVDPELVWLVQAAVEVLLPLRRDTRSHPMAPKVRASFPPVPDEQMFLDLAELGLDLRARVRRA